MGRRYSTEDRISGGSMEGRLNPDFGSDALNTKHGPSNYPSPLIRSTGGGNCIREQGKGRRRGLIGLPGRFDREQY